MSTLSVLPEGQDNNIEVTQEDQNKINEFSKLILRQEKIKVMLDSLHDEKEYIDELSLELELMDEDEKLPYKLGDSAFINMKVGKIIKLLEKDLEEMNTKEEELAKQVDDLEETLKELKKTLYAKFGNNINMER
ncbi:related to Prefoldin subunit 4 [Hanseniaspora guilliermondii]|uniref:Prefoldin subunit 4 n=1 Tax=Hanseniaspora guilliermondii TaxID=56406 RepID=A0A1L0B0G6_9ASCO|nr:related to Prefoldin subunit 4 [Hanseniaspora guilliermondii]